MAAKCADPFTSSLNSSPVENLILNYKMMKPLDEALRCRICFDYFNNCMMTKCSHNYCSICIRKYMTYKSQCPTCFQDAFEPELRNNRLIDEILRLYKKLRKSANFSVKVFVDILPNLLLFCRCQKELDENSAYALKSEDDSSQTVYLGEVHKDSKANAKAQSSSSSKESFTPRIKIEIPDSKKSYNDSCIVSVTRDPDFKEVTCPVCYKEVLSDRINSHLDMCLKQQYNDEPNRKKTLPKLVYHLLSEKDIKLKLKEHGLSVSGSRQTLIRRHKNFVTLYNANCDSLNPKEVSDLVKEIELQELEEKINSLPKQFQVNKKSDLSVIEEQNKSYVHKHQSQFNALINDVHHRQIAQINIKPEKDDDDESLIGNYAQIQIKQEKEDDDSPIEDYENEDSTSIIKQGLESYENKMANVKHPNLDAKTYKDDCSDTSTSSSEEEIETRRPVVSFRRKRKKATVNLKSQESPKKK